MITSFISGAIMFGYLIAGLFFARFWKRTQDRFFCWFAVAFWILALERVLLVAVSPSDELRPYVYTVRLFAFLLIILAIIDKNRQK